MTNNNICGLTTAEIEELKATHGYLILATVKQGESTYHAIFKEPNEKVLESTRKISQKNEIQASLILYKNLVVAADEAFESRDFLRLKAAESIGVHMSSFSVDTKNL